MEKIYTVDETCDLLSVGRDAVLFAVRQGRLRASKISGKWRITESAIMEFMQANENTTHAES